MKEIRKDMQVNGYASKNDFRDLILNDTQSPLDIRRTVLKTACIDTILGAMIAIADEESLYLLEFVARHGLEREIDRLRARGFAIIAGTTAPLQLIEAELTSYFSRQLKQFETPYHLWGSLFQQQVWKALCDIPFGETRTYAQQALSMGKPKAYRAVANANSANHLAIIVPCHRIIRCDGQLGGYNGGIAIKQWLLKHETAL